MSNLIKMILNGITSTTSNESEEKEMKMINFKTNVPEIDQENAMLIKAADLLQKCGNTPGLTAHEFYAALLADGITIDSGDFRKLSTAAIAIETMMSLDADLEKEGIDPTVH